MTAFKAPIPDNEMERLAGLADLDIDYSDKQLSFKDLATLAAKVAGTTISLVNLIDSLTQWTISNYGLDIEQMLREDSICQYTIMEADHFEVPDLQADERFKDKDYVSGEPNVRYYYGIPLTTSSGHRIGALCVLDKEKVVLNAEQVDLLKIIAEEIVNKLKTLKLVDSLKSRLSESRRAQKKLAHDIRNPLGGIVGLAQIIQDQGYENEIGEVLEFTQLMLASGKSILDLTQEILSENNIRKSVEPTTENLFNLTILRDRLYKLYAPQARQKHINLEFSISENTAHIRFSKNSLLQIIGNLISNSIKFTPAYRNVSLALSLLLHPDNPVLQIVLKDEGIGMEREGIEAIYNGHAISGSGTAGELGFGYGLALVKHLIDSLNGKLLIDSTPGQGSIFIVEIPQQIY